MGGHGGSAYMGWWGNIGSPKQKGITTYAVSPFAQNPLAHVWEKAIFNTFRRAKSQVLYMIIPFTIGYYVLDSYVSRNEYLYTKAGREELLRELA